MFAAISNILKVEDLRTKIIFTLLMLVVFRIGAFIPVPFVNADVLNFQDELTALGLINTFGGGALENFSIFATGIMPYITASIIVQLLTMDVIPKFAQWAREGEEGKRKLAQFTRYGTIVLGFITALGMAIGFNNMLPGLIPDPNVGKYFFIATVLTAGTAFLMWLGEQITEKGIGNGISILIFAGIVAGIPTALNQLYILWFGPESDAQLFLNIIRVSIVLLVILVITVGVIYIINGLRKIPVQYAKRVVGRKMYGGQSTHIPLKVNAAGVIPVIFAMSLMVFPTTIANFWRGNAIADWIIDNFSFTNAAFLGMFFYVILIIGFTYFYTFVQINPLQLAENMKKNGGYIPGIRPGKTTAVYMTKILNRITLSGAIFLAAISVLPLIFGRFTELPASVQIGGTGLLIVVGVALDTMRQVNSQLIKRHYKGFIK